MGNKLFIGSLSWGTDEAKLQEAFESYGEISEVKVISDRDSGRSRGFGFVTFANAEDAKKAQEEMNGKSLDGREIKVDLAADKGAASGGGYQRDHRGGGERY